MLVVPGQGGGHDRSGSSPGLSREGLPDPRFGSRITPGPGCRMPLGWPFDMHFLVVVPGGSWSFGGGALAIARKKETNNNTAASGSRGGKYQQRITSKETHGIGTSVAPKMLGPKLVRGSPL